MLSCEEHLSALLKVHFTIELNIEQYIRLGNSSLYEQITLYCIVTVLYFPTKIAHTFIIQTT